MSAVVAARRTSDGSGLLARTMFVVAAALAATGLAVASYLAMTHAAGEPIVCGGVGDCNYVNSSEYADVAGVPVSVLGAISYAVMLALVLGVLARGWQSWLLAAWGVATASFAFSAYLTYIELFVIDAICAWCVASAAIATALFVSLSVALWAKEGG
jgi:uncharacterized membrane protein